MLFGPIMLSVYKIYNTEGCDICRDVSVGFKVFKVKINILFSECQKLIANGRRWVIVVGQETLWLKKSSCDTIYFIVNASHPINFNHVAFA